MFYVVLCMREVFSGRYVNENDARWNNKKESKLEYNWKMCVSKGESESERRTDKGGEREGNRMMRKKVRIHNPAFRMEAMCMLRMEGTKTIWKWQ